MKFTENHKEANLKQFLHGVTYSKSFFAKVTIRTRTGDLLHVKET